MCDGTNTAIRHFYIPSNSAVVMLENSNKIVESTPNDPVSQLQFV